MMLGHLALPRDLPPGVTADEAIEWTRTHLDGQRLLLATIAFLAWDWLITLDDEKEFIWQENPLTVTKGLFVVLTYPGRIGISPFYIALPDSGAIPTSGILIFQYWCGHILDLAAYGSVVSIAVVEIVLLLRLWALYARNKKFGIFLIVVFLVGTGTALAIREVQPPDDFKLVHEPPISLTICKRSSPSELFFLYAIVLLVETMTFSLLLWKVWQLSAVGVAPILRTMLKHGTQYYLIVFLALFIQVLGTIVQPLFQPLADALPVVAIASVACSRLVLSLRGLYTAPRQNTTTQDFHARSGTTMGPLSRPVPLSVLRSQRESKSYLQTLDMTPDEERGLPYNTDTIPSPIMEEDGEHTDVDPSTRRTRSFETGHHSKGSWHAI